MSAQAVFPASDNWCTICQDPIDSADQASMITCLGKGRHPFHVECIKPWLQKKRQCPNCRADISRIPITQHTKLMFSAIELCDAEMLQRAIDSGADVDAQDDHHESALTLAV